MRILYSPPKNAPTKVYESGREGDPVYHAKWSDGSEYMAGGGVRRYHGPLFNRQLNDWYVERFSSDG